MLMETFLKENSTKIKQTDMEYTSIRMEALMKDTGITICSKAKGQKSGLMAPNMKGTTKMVRKKELENMYGLTIAAIMETGEIT